MSIGIISQILENILYKNTNGQGSTLPCLRETGGAGDSLSHGESGIKSPKNGVFMLEKSPKCNTWLNNKPFVTHKSKQKSG